MSIGFRHHFDRRGRRLDRSQYISAHRRFSSDSVEAVPSPEPTPEPEIEETRLMLFGGQRNQIHFAWVGDEDLDQAFAPNYVWDLAHTTNAAEWLRLRDLLKSTNPNIVIGYYHTSCTALPIADDTASAGDYYKYRRIHHEDIETEHEDWYLHYNGEDSAHRVRWSASQPNRSYLDITNADVRAYIITLAVSRAVAAGLNAVSFDNCYSLYGIPTSSGEVYTGSGTVAAGSIKSAAEWTAGFVLFYQEAAVACAAANRKLIVNIAARATEIPEAIASCIDHVDAFMTEMAFHENARNEPCFSAELAAYESLVRAGKSGLLFMATGEDVTQGLNWIRDMADQYNNDEYGLYMSNIGTFEWHQEYLL